MATVNIGSLKFNWKGAYNGSTAYAVDDVTEYNGSSYICILASTGNLPTNTTYFQPMATKGTDGTDGTDVGTTITTQGDILYRDGSGLQRLAAGTNGHFLKTQGTGANPVWAESGGTHVKLASGTISSAISQLDLDHFSSTYTHYYLVGSNFSGSSEQQFRARFRTGGSNNSSGNYIWCTSHPLMTSGSSSHNSHGGWNNGHLGINGTNNVRVDNDEGCSFQMNIYQPYQGNRTWCNWHSSAYETGTQFNVHMGSGFYNANTSFNGISIFFNGGNIDKGDYALYGVKY